MLALGVVNCFAQKWTTKDFAISLHQLVSRPENIYVNSGYTTVRPSLYSMFGVADFFSAPFAASDFRFSVKVKINGQWLEDAAPGKRGILFSNGSWQPDAVTRNGLFYRMSDSIRANLKVTTELIPLYGKSGFLLTASFQNLDERDVLIDAQETIVPGNIFYLPLNRWTFGVPVNSVDTKQVDSLTWQGRGVALRAFKKNTTGLNIAPGQAKKMYWAIVMDTLASLPAQIDYEACEKASRDAWQQRLNNYLQTVPKVTSSLAGLSDYYKRSLVSGLVCIWEKPSFLFSPYLSTSGMDGGAMNCYLWDLSYAANMVAQLFGKKAEDILLYYKNIDLEKAYAFTPDGKPSGVKYSYSPYSFTYLVSTLAKYLGVNKELYNEAKRLTENVEAKAAPNGLVDFGGQDNLLEMKTSGYEHFVVSPNAERAWSLRALAEMHDAVGLPLNESRQWRKKADSIAMAIKTHLWDDSTGWFISLYPSGHKEYVYSIQAYDAVHAGVCTPAMQRKLLSRLADKQFLSPYGISSVSQSDALHYEYNDTDWGGSGAYTGDGPQVVQMLYALGNKELAWSVLKRFFWMGQHLAYFPQEHYVDKPQHPSHKRSNVIAGLMGAEVILYSMVGFQPRLDGTLWLAPKLPSSCELTVTAYQYKGHSFTISFANNRCTVYKDGSIYYEGNIKEMRLL
jgi:hypothetical protein